jgi:protein-tyrosine phosphatase
MGNICRSPTAEGVFRHLVAASGLEQRIRIESAGTHAYHVGHPPDSRAVSAAARRGYDLTGVRARQVVAADFAVFDYVLAMDAGNLALLREMAPGPWQAKPQLLLDFSTRYCGAEVPDPYYGEYSGFELVLDMTEDGAAGLLEHIRKKLG